MFRLVDSKMPSSYQYRYLPGNWPGGWQIGSGILFTKISLVIQGPWVLFKLSSEGTESFGGGNIRFEFICVFCAEIDDDKIPKTETRQRDVLARIWSTTIHPNQRKDTPLLRWMTYAAYMYEHARDMLIML